MARRPNKPPPAEPTGISVIIVQDDETFETWVQSTATTPPTKRELEMLHGAIRVAQIKHLQTDPDLIDLPTIKVADPTKWGQLLTYVLIGKATRLDI